MLAGTKVGAKWEDVGEEDEGGVRKAVTKRLRVPGGWLYRVICHVLDGDDVLAITFVPNPHEPFVS